MQEKKQQKNKYPKQVKAQAENGKDSLTESKNLTFWKIKKKKRNSNYLYYVPGTKTEGTSQPSKSHVCKLFNVWDRNQKIMLFETSWKRCHISKFEHILHRLGSMLSHWMRGAPVDLASVENNCIPQRWVRAHLSLKLLAGFVYMRGSGAALAQAAALFPPS